MNPQQKEFDTALANLTPEERATYVSKNPVVNVGGVQQTLSPSTKDTTITGDVLASTEAPMNITNPKPSTAVEGLGELVSAGAQTNLKEYEMSDARKAEEQKLKKQGTDIGSFLTERKGQAQLTEELSAPVDTAEAELRDINNQILQEEQANRRRIEALQKNPQGLFGGALQDEINRINNESIAKRADLSVIQMAKQGKYDSAKAIADRKVAALMEQQKNELEAKMFNYTENKELFTKSEQRDYEQYLSNEDRRIKKEETTTNAINTLGLEYLKNGGDIATAQKIFNSKTIAEAASLGGSTLGELTYKELPDGRAVMLDKAGNVKRVISDGKTKDVVISTEDAKDPFITKLANSAGGKPLTDTFAQKLDKGLTVLGQLGVLQTNIQDVKTGPIVGLFKGANPWDTNAQTIKAQLNAIVPNLARGVYGEVGVLTDNDIATYSKTLPNLSSTEDIRNAVLGITVDLIGKSIKRTLEVNAANGKDVSGFIDLYKEMESTRDSIFSQIPGYSGKLSPKDNAFSQSLGTGTSSIITNGGYNIPQ